MVTSRGLIRYVVTEYGVAYLHGKSIRERAKALIEISHPKFREELYEYCERTKWLQRPQTAEARRREVNHGCTGAGKVKINTEECKGCGLCVESCPPKCLELQPALNAYGVHPARYTGETARDAAFVSTAVRSRARSRFTA